MSAFSRTIAVATVMLALFCGAARGATIHVPGSYPTIQAALDAAAPGDTVLVKPGTYGETIDFHGLAVTLTARDGAAVTFLDGEAGGSTVTFASSEGLDTVIEGFTISGGTGTEGPWSITRGGGIVCDGASPTIRDCRVTGNTAQNGGGLSIDGGSPRIENTLFADNSGFKGGGIYCRNGASPEVVNCTFRNNSASGHGGAICCWSQAAPILTNVTIYGNRSDLEGGGVYCNQGSTLLIRNAILFGDSAPRGPEIWIGSPTGSASLDVDFSDVAGGEAQAYVSAGGTLLYGPANIDLDPLFSGAAEGDLHLTAGSPCLDTGDNAAPAVPSSDFEGDERVVNGTVDLGADEFFQAAAIHVPLDYGTIQAALDAAAFRDTVLVEPGTYYETIDFHGRDVTLRSTGGAAVTVLDGGLAGSVVTFSGGEGPDAVLDGFTITGGTGTPDGSLLRGGGVYCASGTSPLLRNNVIRNNSAHFGGGIHCAEDSMVRILDSEIRDNTAEYGGGVSLYGLSGVVQGCTITDNACNTNGGGVYCNICPADIRDSYIAGNTALSGGGICCTNSNAFILDNELTGNETVWNGAGIYCVYCQPLIEGNRIYLNQALDGGGIACLGAAPRVLNNTIYFNVARNRGGGILSYVGSAPLVVNTIIWGCLASNGSQVAVGDTARPSSIEIRSCCVQDGEAGFYIYAGCSYTWGAGNLTADPLLADPVTDDLHLTALSPCRDAGELDVPEMPPFDFEGDRRGEDGFADIGADEFGLRLYHEGTASPGSPIRIRVLGPPGEPVLLVRGSGVMADDPDETDYGLLYLDAPLTLYTLGNIPATGLLDIQYPIPGTAAPGDIYPLQALVGAPAGPGAALSNLHVIVVE